MILIVSPSADRRRLEEREREREREGGSEEAEKERKKERNYLSLLWVTIFKLKS